jgi:hypothetical protein
MWARTIEETAVETLVTVHSWVRWLVLLALVGGAVVGLHRYRSKEKWEAGIYQIGVMTVDLQIAIGIVIWIERKGWNYTFFFSVLHPIFMLVALTIAHLGLVLAKRRSLVFVRQRSLHRRAGAHHRRHPLGSPLGVRSSLA